MLDQISADFLNPMIMNNQTQSTKKIHYIVWKHFKDRHENDYEQSVLQVLTLKTLFICLKIAEQAPAGDDHPILRRVIRTFSFVKTACKLINDAL